MTNTPFDIHMRPEQFSIEHWENPPYEVIETHRWRETLDEVPTYLDDHDLEQAVPRVLRTFEEGHEEFKPDHVSYDRDWRRNPADKRPWPSALNDQEPSPLRKATRQIITYAGCIGDHYGVDYTSKHRLPCLYGHESGAFRSETINVSPEDARSIKEAHLRAKLMVGDTWYGKKKGRQYDTVAVLGDRLRNHHYADTVLEDLVDGYQRLKEHSLRFQQNIS